MESVDILLFRIPTVAEIEIKYCLDMKECSIIILHFQKVIS